MTFFPRYGIAKLISWPGWPKLWLSVLVTCCVAFICWMLVKIDRDRLDSAYRRGEIAAETRCWLAHGARLAAMDSAEETRKHRAHPKRKIVSIGDSSGIDLKVMTQMESERP